MADIGLHYGYWSRFQRTVQAIIGKQPGGLYPGIDVIVGRDPLANRNLTRGLAFPYQVEAEHRPPVEQTDLLYQAETSGRPANTGQPLNAHAILYLTSAPDKQQVVFNNGEPPQMQTFSDLARTVQAARGLLRR